MSALPPKAEISLCIHEGGLRQVSSPAHISKVEYCLMRTAFRVASTLALWITIDSTAVVTANSAAALIPANMPEYFAVTPGQVLNFISTSTSTGYVCLTEMS